MNCPYCKSETVIEYDNLNCKSYIDNHMFTFTRTTGYWYLYVPNYKPYNQIGRASEYINYYIRGSKKIIS